MKWIEIIEKLLKLSFADLRMVFLLCVIGFLCYFSFLQEERIQKLSTENSAYLLQRDKMQHQIIDSLNHYIITQKIQMSKECEDLVEELITERINPSIDRYKKLIITLNKLEKEKEEYEKKLINCQEKK